MALATSCKGKEAEQFTPWEPKCSTRAEGGGEWTTMVLPEYVTGIANLGPQHVTSDGETLTVYRDAFLASLAAGSPEFTRPL